MPNTSTNQSHYKRIFFFFLRLGITVAIFAYLFRKIDFHYLAVQMLHVNVFYIMIAIFIGLVSYSLMAIRWHWIIKALNASLTKKQALKLLMIGMFFNQFMLASVGGDAVRIWLATRHHISPRIAINSTLFDRLCGLLMVILLIIVCLPIYSHVLPSRLTFISLSLLVTAVLMGTLVMLFLDRIPLLSRLSLFQKIFGKISEDARTVFLSFKKVKRPLAYSAFAIMMPSIMVYFIGQAYHFPISFMHSIIIIPAVMLVSLLPMSIAGWGVREGSMVVVAGYLGVAPSQAVLVSVWLGIALLIASLPGAIFWLIRKGAKPMKIEYETNVTPP